MDTRVKAILVDDEQLALDYLNRLLNKIGGVKVVGTFTKSICGGEGILRQKVDVVFLDIQLPEISGLE